MDSWGSGRGIWLFKCLQRIRCTGVPESSIGIKVCHGRSANRPLLSASAISLSRNVCAITEIASFLNPTYTEAIFSGSSPRWAAPATPRVNRRSFGITTRRYRYSNSSIDSRSCSSESFFLRCSTGSELQSQSTNRISPRIAQTARALRFLLLVELWSQEMPLATQLGISSRPRASIVHTSSPTSGSDSGRREFPAGLPAIFGNNVLIA